MLYIKDFLLTFRILTRIEHKVCCILRVEKTALREPSKIYITYILTTRFWQNTSFLPISSLSNNYSWIHNLDSRSDFIMNGFGLWKGTVLLYMLVLFSRYDVDGSGRCYAQNASNQTTILIIILSFEDR